MILRRNTCIFLQYRICTDTTGVVLHFFLEQFLWIFCSDSLYQLNCTWGNSLLVIQWFLRSVWKFPAYKTLLLHSNYVRYSLSSSLFYRLQKVTSEVLNDVSKFLALIITSCGSDLENSSFKSGVFAGKQRICRSVVFAFSQFIGSCGPICFCIIWL